MRRKQRLFTLALGLGLCTSVSHCDRSRPRPAQAQVGSLGEDLPQAGDGHAQQQGALPPLTNASLAATSTVVPPAASVPAPTPTERWLTPAQIDAVGLQTVSARVGAAPSAATLSGRIAFDDLQVAHVVPAVNGLVTKVLVQQGEHVIRGQSLACINSPQLSQAAADVESSHVDLSAAELELARTQALFADRAVAQKELERCRRRQAEAAADYRKSLEKLELLGGKEGAKDNVYVVRAPIDGNVIVRQATVGSQVQGQYENGPSAPKLFTLGSLQTVWACADVFDIDLGQVHLGDRVEVSVVAYPQQTFIGRVDWVAPNVDADSGATRLRCRLDNRDHKLKPEMFVTLQVITAGQQGVVVPLSAVFYLEEKTYVFVRTAKTDGQGRSNFVRRKVTVHEDADGGEVAVLEGLQGGEQVVARGGILLVYDEKR